MKPLRQRMEFLFLLHQAFTAFIEQIKYNLRYAVDMVESLEKNLSKGDRCQRSIVSDTYRQNTSVQKYI